MEAGVEAGVEAGGWVGGVGPGNMDRGPTVVMRTPADRSRTVYPAKGFTTPLMLGWVCRVSSTVGSITREWRTSWLGAKVSGGVTYRGEAPLVDTAVGLHRGFEDPACNNRGLLAATPKYRFMFWDPTTDLTHQDVNASPLGFMERVVTTWLLSRVVVARYVPAGRLVTGGSPGRGVGTCRVSTPWVARMVVHVAAMTLLAIRVLPEEGDVAPSRAITNAAEVPLRTIRLMGATMTRSWVTLTENRGAGVAATGWGVVADAVTVTDVGVFSKENVAVSHVSATSPPKDVRVVPGLMIVDVLLSNRACSAQGPVFTMGFMGLGRGLLVNAASMWCRGWRAMVPRVTHFQPTNSKDPGCPRQPFPLPVLRLVLVQ